MHGEYEKLTDYLSKHNIKPSLHRIKILHYLLNNFTHPTADEIYTALQKEIPTLSKTTVYNTLTLFSAENVLKCIYIEENEMRYDARLFEHGHFKCRSCGMVYDFAVGMEGIQSKELKGFKVEERDVYFKGLCLQCLDSDIKN